MLEYRRKKQFEDIRSQAIHRRKTYHAMTKGKKDENEQLFTR